MALVDRAHAMELIHQGVDFQIRETFESAMRFGAVALEKLGVPEADANELMDEVRRLDAERPELQVAGGMFPARGSCKATCPCLRRSLNRRVRMRGFFGFVDFIGSVLPFSSRRLPA